MSCWPISTRKRRDLSISEKNDLLKKYDELPTSMSQRQAAEELRISQPLLSRLLKNRYDIEASFANNELCHSRKRKRCGKDEEVETALKEWFVDARKEIRVDGSLLKQKAEELALKMGKEDFQVTNGWFTRWKIRENITYTNTPPEIVEADSPTTESGLCADDEWSSLISEYSAENIYSAHETALYYRALPEHTDACKNGHTTGAERCTDRVTVVCCVSMAGEKRELVVIGEKKEPGSFRGVKRLPVRYYPTTTARVTTPVFSDWLRTWDEQLTDKILLLVDNCTAHSDSLGLENIKISSLPNTTSLRPIINTLKAYYRYEMRSLSLQRAANVLGNDMAQPISLLDAVHLLATSWYAVTEYTIRACFKKGGFLCYSQNDDEMQSVPLPHDLTLNQYDEWIGIDSNLETSTTNEEPSTSGMLNVTDIEDGLNDKDEEPVPTPPSDSEMLNALNVLNRGVQCYGEDFDLHFSYVNYIKRLIERNKRQTKSINNFFRPV